MNGLLIRIVTLSWVLIGAALPASGWGQVEKAREGSSYKLVPKSAKRIKAVMNFEVRTPNVEADQWTLYVAQLPELEGQVDVKTTLFPRGTLTRDLNAGRPILFVNLPSDGLQRLHGVAARVEYEATLVERRLEPREPGDPKPIVATPVPMERRALLASGQQFDYKSAPFQTWLDANKLRRGAGEGEVEFARKAFLVVRKGIKHYEGTDVAHLASRVVEVGKSDFAGITAVYVAALRANGIPARALGGRMVIFNGEPAKEPWLHAKVEFFAPGIGWVPADIAGAIRLNKSPDGLECFGNDSAEFLTSHVGTDLVLDTFFGPKTLEWFPDVSWWVKGEGSFDGLKSRVTMTTDVERLDLAEFLARKAARPGVRKQAAKKAR